MILQNASPKLLLFMAIALTIASASFICLYLFDERHELNFLLTFIGFTVLLWLQYFRAKLKKNKP
jgi:hypothetical protein